MKEIFAYIGTIIGIFLAIFLLGWAIQGNGFFMYKFFAPRYEDVRRNVFENTQSYVEGSRQEILKYKLEYDRAKTQEEKTAIKFIIVQRFSNIDESKFAPEIRDFVKQMKYN